MATTTPQPTTVSPVSAANSEVWAGVKKMLRPLASLRLTVVLFALAIVLVLAGTLAQDTMSIEAVKAKYFKVWFTFLNLQLLFPSGFFPQGSPLGSFDLWMVFPGGKTLGLLMLVNLLAAHTVRFTIQGRGPRLWIGLGVIAMGALVTAAVIASGMNTETIYQPVLSWDKIWYLLLSSLAGVTLLSIYGAFTVPPEKKLLSWLLIALAAALLAATVWLGMRTFYQGVENARLEAPSMRILWQLLKGTFAGVVLLAGCILAFKKRAGIVLLHGGVALLMISELMVNLQAVETRISLVEGESTNFAFSIQEVELAVVNPLDAETEQVVVIPQHMLTENDGRISHEELPFDLEIVRFYSNSTLLGPAQARQQEAENLATAGLGKNPGIVAIEAAEAAGSSSGPVSEPAAYVRLYEKGSDDPLGTYLLGVFQERHSIGRPERVSVEGHDPLEVSLRFKRYYNPYTVELIDTGRDNYIGTNTPSDYYSVVRITDPSRNIKPFEHRIWMNNPLRYAGQTFYQSGHTQLTPTVEGSTLQVVKNTSWMIPYVSCMIVGVGMLFQFSLTLSRFLNRQQGVLLPDENPPVATPAGQKAKPAAPATGKGPGRLPVAAGNARRFDPVHWALGAALVLLCGVWLIGSSAPPRETEGEFNYYAAGKIPVVYGGRIQPLDSLARNQLRIIQGKQQFEACMGPEEIVENWDDLREDLLDRWPTLSISKLDTLISDRNGTATVDDLTLFIAAETGEETQQVQRYVEAVASSKQPAIRWLLDVMMRPQLAVKHRVFRIENIDLVDQLGLEHRSGLRYSYAELHEIVPGETPASSEPAAAEAAEIPDNAETAEDGETTDDELPLMREFASIKGLPAAEMTLYQRKVRDLQRRMDRFNATLFACLPTALGDTFAEQSASLAELEANEPPLLAPPLPALAAEEGQEKQWGLFPRWAIRERRVQAQTAGDREFNPAVADLLEIYDAYGRQDADQFNASVDGYLTLVNRSVLEPQENEDLHREAFFNHFQPFFLASLLYLSSFLLIAVSWLISGLSTYEVPVSAKRRNQSPPSLFKRLVNPQSLRLAAVSLIGLTLAVHTWALWQRMLISGRPPVTNLYSSAVFIGWAAVVLGLVLEFFFRRGLGAAMAAWAGYGTLLVANFLSATGGDTFTVMQAVLDTQFWLATHVVCVTLGYATTFLAGLLGIAYILGGLSIPRFASTIGKDLARMVYGILCFAIFFSFVGTVLGGLWADDSWGRFWGWDPKENGALIIVLWNALVLHARWAGMVRDRGLAVLAVAGNITTAWSWFGVNELGIGLHSYGFTEGMLAFLGIWCLVQLAVIAAGSLPKKYWRGFQNNGPTPAA